MFAWLYVCIARAPLVHRLYPRLLGGPFFTSVPSGRVGLSKVRISPTISYHPLQRLHYNDLFLMNSCVQDYGTNEAFVSAIKEAEARDRGSTLQKIGAMSSRACLQNVHFLLTYIRFLQYTDISLQVGISRLRSFLEAQVEDCYRY